MADIELGTIWSNIAIRTDNAYKSLENLVDRFNKFGEKGRQRIEEVSKAFENISGLAKYEAALYKTKAAAEQQKKEIAELTRKMQEYRASLPKGEATESIVSEKFGARLSEAKTKLAEYEKATQGTTEQIEAYVVSQQEAAIATAEQKAALLEAAAAAKEQSEAQRVAAETAAAEARAAAEAQNASMKNTTLTSYALSMGLRNLSSITGGAVGNLSDLASQVVYLRQVMKASQTGAPALTAGITGVMGAATIAATVIMKLVEAHNAEVEARRKATHEAAEYVQTAQQEARAAEVALNTLKSNKATTDETTAAKNELARLFPNLVTGWTDEGNAILASNSAIEAQISLAKETIRVKRELASMGAGDVQDELKKSREKIEGYDKEIERLEDVLKYEKEHDNQLYVTETIEAEIAKNQLDRKNAEADAIKAVSDALSIIESQVKSQIGNYEDLNTAQQLIINTALSEATTWDSSKESIDEYLERMRELSESGYRDLAFAAEAAANDTEKLADAEAELADCATKAAAAEQALKSKINDTTSGLNALSSAYNTLNKGEDLSIDSLLRLIDLYPDVAKYIAETGDLTLQNGEYLKTVAKISVESAKAQISSTIASLEAEKTAAEARVRETESIILSLNGLTAAAHSAGLAMQVAFAQGDVDSIQAKIDAYMATLEGLANYDFNFSSTGGGGGGGSRKSAYEQALSDLEDQKQLNDWTERETLEHLEKIDAMYKKSAEEQRDMDLKLHDQRKRAREEELAIEEAHLEYLTAIGEDTAAMWEDYYRRVAESAKEGSAEQWKYRTEAVEREKQAVQDLIDSTHDEYSHKRAMGEEYLYDYIVALQELLKNEQLTTEQRLKLEEDLYAARNSYKDQLMADDEYRLWEMHLGEEELTRARIEMIDYWLTHYDLAEEKIRELLKERYDLEMSLIEKQKKEIEVELKAAQDKVVGMLGGMKAAWKDWAVSVKNTISEYLKALDDMTKEEDRAEKLAEKNRKIDETRLKLAYENDLTNMRNLSKELSKLEKEKNKMLSGWALEDTKAALKELSEQVGELSESQQNSLDSEISRIKNMTTDDYMRLKALYGENFDATDLTSFSQADTDALMKQFQTSIDASLVQYAGTYKNVGVTLGQSIEEGFKSALQSVQSTFDYFKSLQGQLTGQAASVATQAALDYEARQQTTNHVTQTISVNFYQPVQSPYEVARAVEETGHKLLGDYYH